MKYYKKIVFAILCMCPIIVFASGGDKLTSTEAFIMEVIITIFISAAVLRPISKMIAPKKNKILFLLLFIARIWLVGDYILNQSPYIAVCEFVGMFFLIPIVNTIYENHNKKVTLLTKLNSKLSANQIGTTKTVIINQENKNQIVSSNYFDSIYQMSDDSFIQEYVIREIKKYGLLSNSRMIPQGIFKRKKVFNIILSMIIFMYISLLFFHFNAIYYAIGFIIIMILYYKTKKYDLINYCIKEIKSRPQEKVSNIMMTIKNNLVEDKSNNVLKIGLAISIIIPSIIFIRPRVFYEELYDGYSIRFYTVGVIQDKAVTIPSTYKDKSITSVRGDVFANMYRINEIILPDTITEIRGQAFKNNKKLKSVKLPNRLVTLGGGAFENCESLESITFPDTVIEIGGEAFLNAKSLKEVKLPKYLTEIRGNTFENCTSLRSIEIPNTVTRIAAHAFRANHSLENVIISKESKLQEIGSSAFRECYNLTNISIPKDTLVNERAFKNSPTTINYYN